MNIKICQLDFLKLKLSEKNHFLMSQVVNDQGRFKTIPLVLGFVLRPLPDGACHLVD